MKALRKALGLTQKQMGEALGVKKQTYADLERGRRIPSGSSLLKLAKTFGVTIEINKKGIIYNRIRI